MQAEWKHPFALALVFLAHTCCGSCEAANSSCEDCLIERAMPFINELAPLDKGVCELPEVLAMGECG